MGGRRAICGNCVFPQARSGEKGPVQRRDAIVFALQEDLLSRRLPRSFPRGSHVRPVAFPGTCPSARGSCHPRASPRAHRSEVIAFTTHANHFHSHFHQRSSSRAALPPSHAPDEMRPRMSHPGQPSASTRPASSYTDSTTTYAEHLPARACAPTFSLQHLPRMAPASPAGSSARTQRVYRK